MDIKIKIHETTQLENILPGEVYKITNYKGRLFMKIYLDRFIDNAINAVDIENGETFHHGGIIKVYLVPGHFTEI